MTDNTTSAFYETPEYVAAEALRKLPRMLMAGTPALRAEAATWIPPYSHQETLKPVDSGESDYQKRVGNAVVEPYYSRAIRREVATILGKPIVLQDDVPVEIRGQEGAEDEGFWENVDLKGNDGNVFLRPVVQDAVGEGGLSCVLVDHPEVPAGFKWSDLTDQKMRPYWRHYRATDVLEATPDYINGHERIARVRLREGKNAVGEEQVRILIAPPWNESTRQVEGFVRWELHVRRREKEGGEIVELLDKSGTMEPHQMIPLAVVYFGYEGFFCARPPHLHLAYLNLKHTRQDCEIADDLSVSSGAQMVMAGAKGDERKQRVIGKRVGIAFEDSSAKAEWAERSGTAAKVYMEYQARLEEKMEALGNQPHTQRVGGETATGRFIDSEEAATEIQARVIAVRDFVERLLGFTALYRQEKSGGSVEIRIPPRVATRDLEGLKVAMEAHVKLGVPRPVTILGLMKDQGILPDDFDPDAEVAEAETKGPPTVAAKPPPGATVPAIERVRQVVAAAEAKANGGGLPA